jgi:hypothetical protein
MDDIELHCRSRPLGDQAEEDEEHDLDARGHAAQQVGRQPDARLQLILDGDSGRQLGALCPADRGLITGPLAGWRLAGWRSSAGLRRPARRVLRRLSPCQSHLGIVSFVRTATSGTLLPVCRMVHIMASATIAAVRAEAAALANVAAGLAGTDLARPSPCPPWTVADLLGHVIIGVSECC